MLLAPSTVRSFGICIHTGNSLLFQVESKPTSVDLSKATKLKDVTFRVDTSGVEWVVIALRTITPKHRDLRRISISAFYPSDFVIIGAMMQMVEEQNFGKWSELDRLLVQLWESYSTPPMILFWTPSKWKNARDLMGHLLPEATGGGKVDLFE